ncbi:hypothetical protein C8F01DRAFT_1258114 [Mycena amicta]|nr:hypothetical protein C8F01DRAFT_1258114 [Mycena amicta]
MSQFWRYWIAKYPDPIWIKCLVGFLFVINSSQAGTVIYMAWWYCVTNFNVPAAAKVALWPFPYTAFCTALLALTNQIFQLYRIYLFTSNRILCLLLLAAALAACGTGIAAAVGAWLAHTLPKLKALKPIVTANLSIQVAVDVIIAVVLSVSLTRSKTSIAKTDRVLDTLIRTAIQSGSFTAIFALGTLFSFRFATGTQMLGLFALPIGRIYTHTMLDHFISRDSLRNLLSDDGNMVTLPMFVGDQTGNVQTRNESIMLGTGSGNRSTGQVSAKGKAPAEDEF